MRGVLVQAWSLPEPTRRPLAGSLASPLISALVGTAGPSLVPEIRDGRRHPGPPLTSGKPATLRAIPTARGTAEKALAPGAAESLRNAPKTGRAAVPLTTAWIGRSEHAPPAGRAPSEVPNA